MTPTMKAGIESIVKGVAEGYLSPMQADLAFAKLISQEREA